MKTLDTALSNALSAENSIICFLLDFTVAGTTYYYTDANVDLFYNGNTYMSYGMTPDAIGLSVNEGQDGVTIQIDNSALEMAAIVLNNDALGGAVNLYLATIAVGREIITNGTFDADSDWTKGTGWTISGGTASCDGSQVAATNLRQNDILTIGSVYIVTYTLLNWSAGNVRTVVGGTGAGEYRSADGTYTESITCVGSDDFFIQGNDEFIGDIDNVSCKEFKAIPENKTITAVENMFSGMISHWRMTNNVLYLETVNNLVWWNKRTLRQTTGDCRWDFKGTECGYSGGATSCDRTYANCQTLSNTDNFGGLRFLPAVQEIDIWWGREFSKKIKK